MKKYVLRGLIGMCISLAAGQLICLVVSLAIHNGTWYGYWPIMERQYGSQLAAMLIQTLCNAVLGFIFGFITAIWDKDRWSLTRQTITHFVLVTTVCVLSGYLCFWYPHRLSGVLIALAEYIIIYVIIWICIYTNYRRSVNQINSTKR